MPFLAAIAPILTAVAAAGTLAATGYELANQPGSGGVNKAEAAAVAAQQREQKAQQSAQQKAAFLASQPDVQARTGGGLTPAGFNREAATQAGVPFDLNSIAKYLGLGGTSSPTSANVSGGITSTPGAGNQQPNDLQSLSDLLKAA